jgi:hypothetical protein
MLFGIKWQGAPVKNIKLLELQWQGAHSNDVPGKYGFDSQGKQRSASLYARAILVVHLWWIGNWCESKKILKKKKKN